MKSLLKPGASGVKSRAPIHNHLVVGGAIALVTLSAAINIRYATTAFDFGIDAVLMGALVLAVTLGFVLLPSVSIKLFKSKARSFGVLAALAAIICGGVSLSNIVGASLGHRAATALDAGDVAAKRKAAQDTITKAEAEIAALGSPRPALTIDAEILAVFARTPGLDDCIPRPNWTQGRTQREACKVIAELNKEKAAAGRKAALEDDVREARAILAGEKASKTVGNGDTLAFLTASKKLGWVADAETIDLLKSVGTALAVELFATVLFVLWEISRAGRELEHGEPASIPASATGVRGGQLAETAVNTSIPSISGPSAALVNTSNTIPVQPVPAKSKEEAGRRLLALIREQGGELDGSTRSWALKLGAKVPTLHAALVTLEHDGVIKTETTKRGTRVRLRAA